MKKTDHFAEFRRLQTEIRGNEGNRVTVPEKLGETMDYSSGDSVTQISERRVTRATGPSRLDSDVTRVTHAVGAQVTERERQKTAQNRDKIESVTRVTQVTEQNCDGGRSTVAQCRATWPRSVTPNSRQPLTPPGIRAKIEAIEADARAKGWPAELLWNSGFWDSPRGLACLLDEADEIVEVTADEIVILKLKHDLQRFRRRSS